MRMVGSSLLEVLIAMGLASSLLLLSISAWLHSADSLYAARDYYRATQQLHSLVQQLSLPVATADTLRQWQRDCRTLGMQAACVRQPDGLALQCRVAWQSRGHAYMSHVSVVPYALQ